MALWCWSCITNTTLVQQLISGWSRCLLCDWGSSDFLSVVMCLERTQQQGPAILCQLCQLELVLRCPLHLVVLYLADPVLPLQDHAPSDLNAASMVTKCHLVGLGSFLGMYHCRLPPWVFRSVISDHHWVPHHKASLYSCRPRVHLCCLIFEYTFLHIWYRKLLRSPSSTAGQ